MIIWTEWPEHEHASSKLPVSIDVPWLVLHSLLSTNEETNAVGKSDRRYEF